MRNQFDQKEINRRILEAHNAMVDCVAGEDMSNGKDDLIHRLHSISYLNEKSKAYDEIDVEQAYQKIRSRIRKQQRSKVIRYYWFAAAMVVIGVFVTLLKTDVPISVNKTIEVVEAENDREDEIMIELADGEQIRLDEMADQQSAFKHNKDKGEIVYQLELLASAKEDREWNRIIVPDKKEILVSLSDGSTVYLNGGSELKYPVVFVGSQREVFLKGEGYFDIKKNEQQPFSVQINENRVVVKGTRFNIKEDRLNERLETTLLSGAIDFLHDDECTSMSPGEQLTMTSGVSHLQLVDTLSVVAWRWTSVRLKGHSLREVATILEQWYHIPIEINDPRLLDVRLNGKINRSNSLSHNLQLIEIAGDVIVKQQDNKITIYN